MRLPKALLVLSLLQISYVYGNGNEDAALETNTVSKESTESEGRQVYKKALATLSTLASNEVAASYASSSTARGPITAALRWLKLRSRSGWRSNRPGSGRKYESVGGDEGQALKVIDLLEHAIELGEVEALYTLGEISLLPPSQHLPINASRAFSAYTTHAHLTGNSSSHFKLGFFHSTGYGGVTPPDQKRALLEFTFGAHGEKGDGNGNKNAQMALGYRYWTGVGVNEDCMSALEWYEAAAEQSMARFLMGPPGGRTVPQPLLKLSDIAGGAYGYRSSAASTGFLANRAVIKSLAQKNAGETVQDLIDYYQFSADMNDLYSIFRLGKIFYQGSIYSAPGGTASGSEGVSRVPRDFLEARHWFLKCAREIWGKDYPAKPSLGRRNPKPPKKKEKEGGEEEMEEKKKAVYAALSAGYLGRMYLRGEGVRPDMKLARMWFERGAEDNTDRESLNGLGIMWRDGLIDGSKRDAGRAAEYFHLASNLNLAEAQLNMGKLHYDQGELALATQYLEAAVRNGSPLEAYYYIAEIHAANARKQLSPGGTAQLAMTAPASCAVATSFYKVVAERGCWDEELVRDGNNLWDGGGYGVPVIAGTQRGREEALVRWLMSAEMGVEAAQNNVAYVLDEDKTSLRGPQFDTLKRLSGPKRTPVPHASGSNSTYLSPRVALTYWTRSAAQRNIDALVKVGDYHFYGIGLGTENDTSAQVQERMEKAAGYYQSAVDTQLSALAMWNLGWMYENGVGVPQDFHLAKRYYDLALEANAEGYFPVVLSLIKLYARSLFHAFTGGSQKEKTLLIWNDDADGTAGDGWYLGKSKAEMRKREREREREDGGAEEHAETDLGEYARRLKDEEGADLDFGPEDYFDGATTKRRRAGEDDDDDDFIDTMVLLTLCVMVGGLLWIRARWVEQQRERDRAQQGEQGAAANAAAQPARPAADQPMDLMAGIF